MTTPVHLGVDVGGTASRWTACEAAGRVLLRGKVGGATGHLFNSAERERLTTAFTAIAGHLAGAGLAATTLTAGITGYGAAVATDMRALLGPVIGVAPERITLADDIVLAFLANFQPGEGHLIAAGTGSIGLHIGERNEYIRVGGRGILIDDAGSGSWIALAALDRIYRALDRTGSFDGVAVLARHLFAEIGGSEWHHVRQFVYGGDRGRIGTLAIAVARAADDRDAAAIDILRGAGRELAQLAQALIARAGDGPVGLIGGVLKLHPLIVTEICRELPGRDVRLLDADASLAAAQLPTIGDPRWRALIAERSTTG